MYVRDKYNRNFENRGCQDTFGVAESITTGAREGAVSRFNELEAQFTCSLEVLG